MAIHQLNRICAIGTAYFACTAWFFACSGESADSVAAGSDNGGGTTSTGGSAGSSPATGGGGPGGGGGLGTGGGAPSGGAAGSSGGSETGGTSATDAAAPSDGTIYDVVFEYDPGDTEQLDACVSRTVTAEPVSLDLIILLDSSGSMEEPGGGDCSLSDPINDSKWCKGIHALYGFFSDSSSIGMGVGFRTFAGDTGNCGAYPDLEVSLGILSGEAGDPQLAALEAALNAGTPNGGTPTERALRTIMSSTAARQAQLDAAQSNRKVIGVLITDGEPQNCDTNISSLNALIRGHYESTDIPTYFIGMDGADFAQLDQLADGAGAPSHDAFCDPVAGAPCFYYSVGAGDGTVFVQALEDIRRSAIGCRFAVPTTSTGLVDLDTIEVRFTPMEGAPVEILDRVMGGVDNCQGDGYYTDDDAEPEDILLCPVTCERADAEETAAVNIELLCEGA